jgi:hypothetical protein
VQLRNENLDHEFVSNDPQSFAAEDSIQPLQKEMSDASIVHKPKKNSIKLKDDALCMVDYEI